MFHRGLARPHGFEARLSEAVGTRETAHAKRMDRLLGILERIAVALESIDQRDMCSPRSERQIL